MRRTARRMVVILALVIVLLALAAAGLLWKGGARPDPESPPIWPLPGEQIDGALDVEEDYEMYNDYVAGSLIPPPGEQLDGALDVEEGYKMYGDLGW